MHSHRMMTNHHAPGIWTHLGETLHIWRQRYQDRQELTRDGIAYVPFFPLGGFSPLPSSTLSAVAQRLGATPMQIALAWLLHRAPNMLLIPGTSSLAHLRENLLAAELHLPDDAVMVLEGIAAGVAAA